MLKNEGDRLKRVVVCTPRSEYFCARDLENHNIIQLPDRNQAIQQHDMLKSKLTEFGSEVTDIPELVNHPNSVFTRDTALCTPNGYIKLRLGLDTRQGEEEWMAQALNSLGEPCVGEIKAPGTVEGGDVILAGTVAFVGHSIRTNNEGVEQLSVFLSAMKYKVRIIYLPDSILHLDKAMMVVAPDRILYCNGLIPDNELKNFDTIEISCNKPATANIICLGENEIIIERSNYEVRKQLEANGLIAHDLDLSEFAKGMGGPNCLIMPVERK